MRPKHVATNF